MNITGAIFDMDGTLINSLIVWDMLWEDMGVRYLGKKGFKPSLEDDRAVRTMTLIDAMTLIHNNYSIAESGKELWQFFNDYIKVFYAEKVEVKEDVLEFLDTLLQKGVKMCIASATALDLVEVALKKCGLEKYFSSIISCNDVGKGKDQPDVFLKALDILGTDLDTTWVFEDSALALDTASKAGFKTVGIYDPCNFGHDLARSVSDVYIDSGETIKKAEGVIL